MSPSTTDFVLALFLVICTICLIFAGCLCCLEVGTFFFMLVVEQTAVNTVGKWFPRISWKRVIWVWMFSYTVALYIFRFTVTSAIMVFMNCCSIESLKFILESSGFMLYFTVRIYLGSIIMCHQNPLGDDFPFFISPFSSSY